MTAFLLAVCDKVKKGNFILKSEKNVLQNWNTIC